MATHSSMLAWRIPWTEEPGGRIQSMGSQGGRQGLATEQQHNCVTKGEYSAVKMKPEGHICYLVDS